MKPEETEQLLSFCSEMSRQLIRNGAEIYRVEESASRMLAAYGYQDIEVFAIPPCIIITIRDDVRNYTRSVRIRGSSNNLDRLDRLNDLCRLVCAQRPSVEEAQARLRQVMEAPSYPAWISYLAHGFAAAFFTLFWGGHAGDAAIAFLCGLTIKRTVSSMSRMNANIFFTYVCTSMLLVLVPLILVYLGLSVHLDKIVIGAIMLLVPGLAITNVMRDVLSGDFVTALTKFAEVLIVAMAIAIGIAIPVGFARILLGAP